VMIEGFAEGGPASFYALGDWRLQMDRALGLVRRGKVLIAQSYLSPGDRRARGFVLGSYLLIKGSHTFVNMDIGSEPQWFPEYGIDLGPALAPPPASVDALRMTGGLYVRRYGRGLVAVNPDNRSHVLTVSGPARRVQPIGGGALGPGGAPRGWRLRLVPVGRQVVLPAHSGLVLISSPRG
jgi:hypothetical protein